MDIQTGYLLANTPPATPLFIADLLMAYGISNSASTLQLDLYAEPYYGDYNNCSVVLLTHNPGQSTSSAKGIGSPFEIAINSQPLTKEANYFNIASTLGFPNPSTNTWVLSRNSDLQDHFKGLINLKGNLFIRDLVPYHGVNFTGLDMALCVSYLYKYFFNQVISASFNSELYKIINSKKSKPASIIYARGSAWKVNIGLSSIGWDLIGKIYSNCYIYKANFERIEKMEGFSYDDYPKNTSGHDIYIVVLTQPMPGAKFGIYINKKAPFKPVSIKDVITNYDEITLPSDIRFIKKSHLMDDFITRLRNLEIQNG